MLSLLHVTYYHCCCKPVSRYHCCNINIERVELFSDLRVTNITHKSLPEDQHQSIAAQECAKAEERVYACRKAILGQIVFIFGYFVFCFQLMCLYNYYYNKQWSYPYWD